MRSPKPKRTAIVVAAICAVTAACAVSSAQAAQSNGSNGNKNQRKQNRKQLRLLNEQQKRPNVIVIETDDQNVTDTSVMANTLALLGSRGTTFANSYVSYPLCCPSRATFLTGQYAHNNGPMRSGRSTTSTRWPFGCATRSTGRRWWAST